MPPLLHRAKSLVILTTLVAGCASERGVEPPPMAPELARAAQAVVELRSRGEHSNGVVISAAGLVLSVSHGLLRDEVLALLADGRRVKARVLYRDVRWDLAVLQLEPGAYVHVPLAPSPRTGSPVVAAVRQRSAGGPSLRRGRLLMQGVNLSGVDSLHPRGWRVQNALVYNAPIERGHSGSALLDAEGRLLGINAAGGRDHEWNVAFALPVESYGPALARLAEQGGTPPVDAAPPGLRSYTARRWPVSEEPNLDLDDPAQRCHWVLVGLKRHALRSGLAERRVDSLLDAVEQRALARLARGELEAGGVVRWVWKEAVAALRATSTH